MNLRYCRLVINYKLVFLALERRRRINPNAVFIWSAYGWNYSLNFYINIISESWIDWYESIMRFEILIDL